MPSSGDWGSYVQDPTSEGRKRGTPVDNIQIYGEKSSSSSIKYFNWNDYKKGKKLSISHPIKIKWSFKIEKEKQAKRTQYHISPPCLYSSSYELSKTFWRGHPVSQHSQRTHKSLIHRSISFTPLMAVSCLRTCVRRRGRTLLVWVELPSFPV